MATDTPPTDSHVTPPVPPAPPYAPPPRSRPRGKARWPWLAVPVVIVAAVPAGAWVIGPRVETGYAARQAETMKQAPIFAKARVTYHRAWFGATRTTTLDLYDMYGNCLSQLQANRPRTPMVLSIVEHIEHGPFPGFRSIGAARVTYEARINGQPLASFFGRPLGGADGPVLKLTGGLPRPVTEIGFNESVTTTLKGGAGSLTLAENPKASRTDADAAPGARPAAFTLAWQAIDGRFALNGGGSKLGARLDFDGLAFSFGEAVRLTMGRLAYDADRVKSAEAGWWLPSGKTHFKLDRLEASVGALAGAGVPVEPVFSVADIVVDGTDTVSGGLYAAEANGDFGKLTVLGETLGPIDFDYGFSRLDATGWKSLIDASYGPLLKGCPVPLDKQDPQEKTAETLAAFKSLVLKDPEVHVNRLAVSWGGQQAVAKGALRLVGIEPADLHAPDPTVLLQKLDGQGELRLDDGFVGVVAAAAAKRSVLQAHKTSATASIPPELLQRMSEAKTDAEQQAVFEQIRQAQAKATPGLTDAKLLADPTVQAEIKATTADNVQKAQAARDKLVAQGVLLRDGAQLVVRGGIKSGQPTINGKPAASFQSAMDGDHDAGPDAASTEAAAVPLAGRR